ncbi:adenylyl-sulfate kinase [Vibrio pectenicida]|uniref:Adenylyl-sulfate kinase n=1 Tax=Vibrio pectenicida TaxID=62763 RepID=A0A7Y3ZYD7_9VIBR|nr:adenylyl-sulfate kinase [Vibrio pectenicida]
MANLIWITGLSGSGKTTIGYEVFKHIKESQKDTVFLDGDTFRDILGNDLGHKLEDRLENARRIHRMCKFLISQDINVICATMSLYSEIHDLNRKMIENYFEIFIECSMDELIRRDQKGLYSQAINGERNDVVGINLVFDKPSDCDLIIENNTKEYLNVKVQNILNLIGETNETR